MSKLKLSPEAEAIVEAIVSEPRTLGRLNGAELVLLLTLKRQGYELVQDWCYGPRGPYEHRRIIRKRSTAA